MKDLTEPQSPLSFAQQRLWFLDQLEPGNRAYNLPRAFHLSGKLSVGTLTQALQAMVERHESLRTTFTTVDDQPVQYVDTVGFAVELPLVSLEDVPLDARQPKVSLIAAEEGGLPFDLTTGPLLRAKLLRLSDLEHVLILTMHHIIVDGWSMSIFFDELGKYYDAFSSDCSPDIPTLPIRYADFARWQRESLTDHVLGEKVEYWRKTLRGAPHLLELPADRRRPAVQTHAGRNYSFHLGAGLSQSLGELSRTEHVTLFMTLLAAFQTLLWRYTGIDDFVIGTPVAGRSETEFEKLIGILVNTVPLRANLGGNPRFQELLHRVRDSFLDTLDRQDVPFEKLVEALRPERNLSHTPLFQVMFVFQNAPPQSLALSGIQAEELEFDSGVAKFDLTLEVVDQDGLYCTLEYSTDLFDQDRIVRMAGHFETLLGGIVAEPVRKLSEMPILTAGERKEILSDWNATTCDYPSSICIHEAFEARVEEFREVVAVAAPDRQLTFEQLNHEANLLANYIRKLGVQPLDRVGVAVERSADAIIALMAVLKTGASYVPIDPSYPRLRIAFQLEDSDARVLITQSGLRARLPEHDRQTVYIDRDRPAIAAESVENPLVRVDPDDIAYTIYTSGSTGVPKGVLGTHRASLNRFAWMWKTYPFAADDVCAQQTSLSFVDSIWEVFGPLLQGVPLFVMPDKAVRDPKELLHYLNVRRITRLGLVPSLLTALLDTCEDLQQGLPHLRLCITSGEALPFGLYQRFIGVLPHVTLVNLYGSSEVAADVTCFDTNKTKPTKTIPIGKPISNAHVYILDEFLNPVPIGVPGEIYAGGDCLARGYLNRPELTSERFVADPFHPGSGRRLYRTGDIGCYRADGNIEFLWRADNQVKIRGIRIELGEIESALGAHESVRHSVVMARNKGTADCAIVAYVVPADGQKVAHSELRRYLSKRLPQQMIPSAFVTLEALPLTPNGKLDRRALPEPQLTRSEIDNPYLPPRNATEEKLVEIWTEVLKANHIGVLDNFFELGGHSLMAIQVIARVRKALLVEVPVRSLFEEPTIAGLAVAVRKAHDSGATVRTPILPRRSEQQNREQLIARLSELSEEEVDTLLKTALADRIRRSTSET